MSGPGHIQVNVPVVGQAGHHTAGTATNWQSWGGRIRVNLADLDQLVKSERIFSAIDDFRSQLIPDAEGVAVRVHNLGADTTTATTTVNHADQDSAHLLHVVHEGADASASVFTRPVNSSEVVI